MPVFPKRPEIDDLWAKFHDAQAMESAAVKAMLAALQSGDMAVAQAAGAEMEAAHNRKMAVYQQLLDYWLHKG